MLKFAIRNPLRLAAVRRELAFVENSDVAPELLPSMVHDALKQVDKKECSSRGKQVLKINLNQREYYLRLYARHRVQDAIRHLAASRLARSAYIKCPKILQIFSDVDSLVTIAILEEKMLGAELGYRQWCPEIASNLGQALSEWHSLKLEDLGSLIGMLKKYTTSGYAHALRIDRTSGEKLSAHERQLIAFAADFLRNAAFDDVGRISHGDFQCHNLIVDGDNIAWIDLDQLSLRPIWHDLALAASELMLDQDAHIIDAFEAAYFGDNVYLRDRWWSVRQQWCVLVNVLMAVKWLSRKQDDFGKKFFPSLWARDKLAIASALAGRQGKAISSGEYIAAVYAEARVAIERNRVEFASKTGVDFSQT